MVEQVTVGAVLEQDLESLEGGYGLDGAGEEGLLVLVGDEVKGHVLRGVEREGRGRVRLEQEQEPRLVERERGRRVQREPPVEKGIARDRLP